MRMVKRSAPIEWVWMFTACERWGGTRRVRGVDEVDGGISG